MQSSNPTEARKMMAAYDTDHERDAFAAGYDHAHGIACHNVPTIGDKLFLESEGRVTVTAENIAEIHASLCFEAELNARCFSPWEYTASAINWLDEMESEAAWEAYEHGVSAAITHDLDGYEYEEEDA